MLTNEQIAQVCHEANRALQAVTQDPVPSLSWMEASFSQRESAVEGVQRAKEGATPEELHDSWCDFKVKQGWVFGKVKSEEKKTHPCLIRYDKLPEEQKLKDALFYAVVSALT